MNPKIWGPHGWIFLHTIGYGYPDNPTNKEQSDAISFFNALGTVLPCKTCSELYIKDIKKYPIEDHVKSKTNLIKWINKMHNQVNKNLNKIQYTDIEYDKYYMNLDSSNTNITNASYIGILILIFIIILITYII